MSAIASIPRGNMFVPIDLLPPILGDIIAQGRVSGPGRPWLGISATEVNGDVVVSRVSPGSPAERAGVKAGQTIVGVDGDRPKTLADFYRKVWALGPAGALVPLDLSHEDKVVRRGEIRSANRLHHLPL